MGSYSLARAIRDMYGAWKSSSIGDLERALPRLHPRAGSNRQNGVFRGAKYCLVAENTRRAVSETAHVVLAGLGICASLPGCLRCLKNLVAGSDNCRHNLPCTEPENLAGAVELYDPLGRPSYDHSTENRMPPSGLCQQLWAAICCSSARRACSDFTRASSEARCKRSYSALVDVPIFRCSCRTCSANRVTTAS